jgi:hypothetical protein
MTVRLVNLYDEKIYLLLMKPVTNILEREFSVVGKTKNIYNVKINKNPSCTCYDCTTNGNICKHIYFIMSKVIKTEKEIKLEYSREDIMTIFDDIPKYINDDLVFNIESKESFENNRIKIKKNVNRKNDESCPICLDEFKFSNKSKKNNDIDYCKYGCGHSVHKKCFDKWKQNNLKNTCIICRCDWDTGKHINLNKCSNNPEFGENVLFGNNNYGMTDRITITDINSDMYDDIDDDSDMEGNTDIDSEYYDYDNIHNNTQESEESEESEESNDANSLNSLNSLNSSNSSNGTHNINGIIHVFDSNLGITSNNVFVNDDNYKYFTLVQLKELCINDGLQFYGSKKQLFERLKKNYYLKNNIQSNDFITDNFITDNFITDNFINHDFYKKFTITHLRKICSISKLNTLGTKKQLFNRILNSNILENIIS